MQHPDVVAVQVSLYNASPAMKIASFNINGIKARLPRLIEWLQETQPDAACLQEVKSQDEGFPADEFEKIGYGAIWHGQKSFNGVAILAKGQTPQETQRGLPGDDSDEQARYLEADVNGVRVASIYLPNGNPLPGPKFDYKLAWMRRLRTHASALSALEIPVALVGDYNVIPHDHDIWSKSAMREDALRQQASIAAYRRMLGDGWTDALASHYPAGGVWTYWDYQAGAWQQDHGFRIDHMLLSPQAADRLVRCGVDKDHRGREKASDHAPVWLELR
jgi:exodeoxyribonuclease III